MDHRRLDVPMAEQLLYGPDVVAAFEQVGGKGMTERVGSGVLGPAAIGPLRPSAAMPRS